MEPSSTSYKSLTQAYLRQVFDVLLDSIPSQVRMEENYNFTGKHSLRATFSTVEPADEAFVTLNVHRKPELDFFQFEVTIQHGTVNSSSGFSITDEETIMTAASKLRSFVFDHVDIPSDLESNESPTDMADLLETVADLDTLSNEMLQEFHRGSVGEAQETCRQAREALDELQSHLALLG